MAARGPLAWIKTYRPHLLGIAIDLLIGVPMLWFLIAYGGLPHLWSHHEHRKGRLAGVLVSYTAQGIPGDPVDLEIIGTPAAIDCAFRNAGWQPAEPVTVRSGLRIGASVLLGRAYANAPVSPLYLGDRPQDIAWQRDEGRSADRRHHIRLWQQPGGRWLASATYDRGVGLSLFTLQITHHIGADIDRERDAAVTVLARAGAVRLADATAGHSFGRVHRNGGGDRYLFDGRIARMQMPATCPIIPPPPPAPPR